MILLVLIFLLLIHKNLCLLSTSIYFESLGYTCDSVECPSSHTSIFQDHIYFHMTLSGTHIEAPPLLAQRICSVVQLCIPILHILFVVQHPVSPLVINEQNHLKQTLTILKEAKISDTQYMIWEGLFDANDKMKKAYAQLVNITSNDDYIYHTDLDEFPDTSSLLLALQELFDNKCDAIRGHWSDRLTFTGAMNKMKPSEDIRVQFPLRCHMSEQFVGKYHV